MGSANVESRVSSSPPGRRLPLERREAATRAKSVTTEVTVAAETGAGDKKKSEEKPPRSTEEIQADIQQTRQRLVGTLDSLKEETTPKALAGRAQASVKGVFVTENGDVRVERVAAVVGVVVGLLVLRRGMKARARRRELQRLAEVVWVPVPRAAVSKDVVGSARNASELAPLAQDVEPAVAVVA